MRMATVFHVLVAGGCVLGQTACDSQGDGEPDAKVVPREGPVDAADSDDGGGAVMDAAVSEGADAASEEELTACFCGTGSCCGVDEGGEPYVLDGLFCCWGTSC